MDSQQTVQSQRVEIKLVEANDSSNEMKGSQSRCCKIYGKYVTILCFISKNILFNYYKKNVRGLLLL